MKADLVDLVSLSEMLKLLERDNGKFGRLDLEKLLMVSEVSLGLCALLFFVCCEWIILYFCIPVSRLKLNLLKFWFLFSHLKFHLFNADDTDGKKLIFLFFLFA